MRPPDGPSIFNDTASLCGRAIGIASTVGAPLATGGYSSTKVFWGSYLISVEKRETVKSQRDTPSQST